MSEPKLPKEMYWPCPWCMGYGEHGEHCGAGIEVLRIERTVLWRLQEQAFAAGLEAGREFEEAIWREGT
jgi:hypothetical protein